MDANQEFTFFGIARDEGVGCFAAFQEFFLGVHAEPAFDLRFGVTAHAISFEDGLDFLLKVRSGSEDGQCRRQSGQNSNDGR